MEVDWIYRWIWEFYIDMDFYMEIDLNKNESHLKHFVCALMRWSE